MFCLIQVFSEAQIMSSKSGNKMQMTACFHKKNWCDSMSTRALSYCFYNSVMTHSRNNDHTQHQLEIIPFHRSLMDQTLLYLYRLWAVCRPYSLGVCLDKQQFIFVAEWFIYLTKRIQVCIVVIKPLSFLWQMCSDKECFCDQTYSEHGFVFVKTCSTNHNEMVKHEQQ